MDRCPRCGAGVATQAVQCPQCGLRRAAAPTPPPPPPTPPPSPPPPSRGSAQPTHSFPPLDPSAYAQRGPASQAAYEPQRSRGGAVAAVIGTLAVLIALVGGMLWFQTYGPGTENDIAAPSSTPETPPVSVITETETPPVETPSVSPEPSSASPEAPSVSREPPPNFATTYAVVESGVGFIEVATCDASYTGSGFLVADQTLLTAAHVIEGATDIEVEFDDETVPATVTGVDPAIDLAVLRLDRPVDHHQFEVARADPKPGTQVAVIGFPFGEPKSLTEGTISGLDREITFDSRTYTGLMQTDAAINPGNSGGPVVTIDGSIVGMADAIRKRSQGIGFAVPISQMLPAFNQRASLVQPERPDCVPETTDPDPVLAGVRKTLQDHLDAVNARDYAKDMRQFSAEIRADSTPEQWQADYETTYDDQLQIGSVTGPASSPRVSATFRSQQDPGYGPEGAEDATCLIWSIAYEMMQVGDRWVISGAAGVGDPPWTRCD